MDSDGFGGFVTIRPKWNEDRFRMEKTRETPVQPEASGRCASTRTGAFSVQMSNVPPQSQTELGPEPVPMSEPTPPTTHDAEPELWTWVPGSGCCGLPADGCGPTRSDPCSRTLERIRMTRQGTCKSGSLQEPEPVFSFYVTSRAPTNDEAAALSRDVRFASGFVVILRDD